MSDPNTEDEVPPITVTFGELANDLSQLHQKLHLFLQRFSGMRCCCADTFYDTASVLEVVESSPLIRQLPEAKRIVESARQLRVLMALNVMYFARHYPPALDREQQVLKSVRAEMVKGEESGAYAAMVEELMGEMALEALVGKGR